MVSYFNKQLLTRGRIIFFLLFFLLFLIRGHSQTYQNAKTKRILAKTYKGFQKMESGSYSYDLLFKYFDSDEDTVITKGNVLFYYKGDKQIDFIEHLHRYLEESIDHHTTIVKKDTLLYTFTQKDKKFRTSVANRFSDYYSDTRLLLSNKGEYFKVDSTAIAYYKGKTHVNNKKCYIIEIVYPKETDNILGITSQYTKTLYINKKSFYPEKILQVFNMDGLTQYSELNLKSLVTYSTKHNAGKFISDSLDLLTHIYSEYVPEVITQDTIVTHRDSLELKLATDFKLKQLGGDTIQLSKINSKLVILDFWYVGCAPCIASIPFLNELHKRYKDKGVAFYSINAFDSSTDKIIKIKDLKNIQYPILLGSEEKISDMFNIKSFPTLLIIDKDLNIVYRKRGFGLGMEEGVFSEIDALLNNH